MDDQPKHNTYSRVIENKYLEPRKQRKDGGIQDDATFVNSDPENLLLSDQAFNPLRERMSEDSMLIVIWLSRVDRHLVTYRGLHTGDETSILVKRAGILD